MGDYPDDRKRVRALINGDKAAFDAFFHDYFPRLFRFVMPRVDKDADVAQDICQQTLIRALKRLPGYRGEAALFTWLCQIARNELSDFWRQRQRDASRFVQPEDDAGIQAALDSLAANEANSPDSLRFGEELGRYVQIALDHLPDHYGDVLEWKYLDGLSVEEIAGKLRLTVIATQSVMQRARLAFREAFTTVAGCSLTALLQPDPSTLDLPSNETS